PSKSEAGGASTISVWPIARTRKPPAAISIRSALESAAAGGAVGGRPGAGEHRARRRPGDDQGRAVEGLPQSQGGEGDAQADQERAEFAVDPQADRQDSEAHLQRREGEQEDDRRGVAGGT